MKTLSKEEIDRIVETDRLKAENEQTKSDIAYICMMCDVKIPEGEETDEKDNL